MTVAVSSGDTGAVAVPASFVFTASNWDRARPVTVRGVDDDDTSDETVAVTHTASGRRLRVGVGVGDGDRGR